MNKVHISINNIFKALLAKINMLIYIYICSICLHMLLWFLRGVCSSKCAWPASEIADFGIARRLSG